MPRFDLLRRPVLGVLAASLLGSCSIAFAADYPTRATIGAGNAPPVCDAGGPYAALVAQIITFDGTGSVDPDGTIVDYAWDFGDGRTGGGPLALHVYLAPLTYTVVLRVRDNSGAVSICQTTAAVMTVNTPPSCDAGGPYLGRIGLAIHFDGSGSRDPDGMIVAYAWAFGDGTTGEGTAPQHAYAGPGSYAVDLRVTDNRGAERSCTAAASIGPASVPLTPVISLEPDPLDFGACTPVGGAAGLTFEIANAVFDPFSILYLTGLDVSGAQFGLAGGPALPLAIPGDGTHVAFTLRFTPDSNQLAAGTLAATAPGAANSPRLVPIQGRGNTTPLCDAGGPYAGITGEAIHFDGSHSSDPGGTWLGYAWNFGDGTTGSGPAPNHVYTVHGAFTVRLDLVDDCEERSSCIATALVRAAPICDAGGPYHGMPGVPVQFDGRGSRDPDGTIVDYAWDFGDGFTGTGPTPTHVYMTAGSWEVTLAVRDNEGITRSCITYVDLGPMPVAAVDSLAADVRGTAVLLTWRASYGQDLLGFEVWRGLAADPGSRINPRLVTDDDGDGRLSFLDRNATAGERHVYAIMAVGRGGEREPAGSLSVVVPALAFALHTPRPQPGPLPIEIAFDLPGPGRARARIVAAGGRIVAVLRDEHLPAGRHVLSWTGRDTRSCLAPAGVYLIVLEFGGESRREKLVLAP